MLSTFEFRLRLAWLGAKCKGKTLLVIEIFFTFFNSTALSQSSIVAQYPKKNMIKFSQQPVTKQQIIVFPATIWIWRVIRSNLFSLIQFSQLYILNYFFKEPPKDIITEVIETLGTSFKLKLKPSAKLGMDLNLIKSFFWFKIFLNFLFLIFLCHFNFCTPMVFELELSSFSPICLIQYL